VILAGAAHAFAQKGYAATSMEDIAAASGITKLIVYRHFTSKEELYRAVLERVATRMRDEFIARFNLGPAGDAAANAYLTVAREDPAGFRLLWRHAARERPFAEYAASLRARAVAAARDLLRPFVRVDLLTWASESTVSFLVEATLNWLEWGDDARDDEFVALATSGLHALVGAWAAPR